MQLFSFLKDKIFAFLACFTAFLLLSGHVYAANDISAEEFVSMDKEKLILVDVRTPEEYAEGHIPDAINLPLAQLPDLLGSLPSKDQQLVVYCRSGYRAGKAIDFLKTQGYTALHHLDGDYSGWAQDERPVVKP